MQYPGGGDGLRCIAPPRWWPGVDGCFTNLLMLLSRPGAGALASRRLTNRRRLSAGHVEFVRVLVGGVGPAFALHFRAPLLLGESPLVSGLGPFRWAATLWNVQSVAYERGKSLLGGLLVLLLTPSRARHDPNAARGIQSRGQSSP
jgi:hypothetical protein